MTLPRPPVAARPLRVILSGIEATAVPNAEVAAKLGAVGFPSQSCVVVPTEPVEASPVRVTFFGIEATAVPKAEVPANPVGVKDTL